MKILARMRYRPRAWTLGTGAHRQFPLPPPPRETYYFQINYALTPTCKVAT